MIAIPKKYVPLILLGLLINCQKIQSAAGPVLPPPQLLADNVPPLPAGHDAQSFNFDDVYKNGLFPQYSGLANVNNTSRDAINIDLFTSYFFIRRDPAALPTAANSSHFLAALKAAQQDIANFINHQPDQVLNSYLFKNFQDSLSIIEDRYALAKIEDAVINGNGFLGANVLPNIPNGPATNVTIFRDTINHLMGRIFVVKDVGGVPTIIGSSSGMIIPRTKSGVVVYDCIITCCHSMIPSDTSPDLEFYFVRTQNLDPATGLPAPAAIGATIPAIVLAPGQTYDQIVDTQHLITYLRQESIIPASNPASNNVRRIAKFKSFNKHISKLEHHIPRYNPDTDCGYGFLNTGFTFPAANFAKVKILKNLPAAVPAYYYYAFGYPDFPYYDTATFNLLAQELLLAPLTITRSQNNAADPVNPAQLILQVINGSLRYGAASMKGMSGGPVLIFDPIHAQINILGIVSSGYMDENYACKFW